VKHAVHPGPIEQPDSNIREKPMVDDAKLHQFMGQMLSDLGGAASKEEVCRVFDDPAPRQ
jgi:hypothetical protein